MNLNLKAPANWSELTKDQFRMVVETLQLHLNEEEMLFVLFCQLTGVRRYDDTMKFVTEDGQDFRLQDWELADFCNRFRWIIETEPESIPNPTCKDDYLRDMSFGDWFETDTQLRLFAEDFDMSHFDVILPKLGLSVVKPIGKTTATMISLWWRSVMETIAPAYPHVFEQGDSSQESSYNPFSQLQNFHLLLNDNHPQENAKIDETNVHDVLSALNNKIWELKLKQEQVEKINKAI